MHNLGCHFCNLLIYKGFRCGILIAIDIGCQLDKEGGDKEMTDKEAQMRIEELKGQQEGLFCPLAMQLCRLSCVAYVHPYIKGCGPKDLQVLGGYCNLYHRMECCKQKGGV